MQEQIIRLQKALDELLSPNQPRRVLEAGCGSVSYVRLGKKIHLVGIDVSLKQLERNTLLAEKIQADITTHPLKGAEFDVVVCWEVLEHLPDPRRALKNLVGSLKPGGLLILAFPNVDSVKGLATKFTPHRFHVWFYKHVWGFKDAGKEDHGPFQTYLRLAISPSAIRKFAQEEKLTLVYSDIFESPVQQRIRLNNRLMDLGVRAGSGFLSLLMFRRVDAFGTECIFVLQKGPSTA